MAKPTYHINVLSHEGGQLISRALGAAWETKKGNYRIEMPYYSTQQGDLIYLCDPEQEKPTASLRQHLRRRDQGAGTALYRVFSAKPGANGKVWFEQHGEIVQPSQSDLMLLHVRTLPYPSRNCSLYFAPIEKSEQTNKADTESLFGEECEELDVNSFV